ncbi:MAG: peptide/nickel transport system permease protein, partial [Rhodospirillaceae bacterium]|nr:peptide/nickel transport system permease protein [Rhodospirillaceae bacterium]
MNGVLGDFFGTFLRNRGAAVGLAVLALVGVAAATAGLLFPYSPWDMRGAPFMPPGEMEFLLGSDSLGRDVAAGIAYGARVSLLIGAVSTVVAVLLGITLGAVAGYAGGVVDDAIM